MITNNYKLNTLVGKGTYSKVFDSERLDTEERVAIKTFSTAKTAILDMSLANSVEHPSVISYSDIFLAPYNRDYVVNPSDTEEMVCIVMPLMDGDLESLHELKGKVDVDFNLLTRDLFAGLQAIHNKGFIFCDIFPNNILYKVVGNGINVKLIDFGEACLMNWGGKRFNSDSDLKEIQAFELRWLSEVITDVIEEWGDTHISSETRSLLESAESRTITYNMNTDNFIVPVNYTSSPPDWSQRRVAKIMREVEISQDEIDTAIDIVEECAILPSKIGDTSTLFDYRRIMAVALWFSFGRKYGDFCSHICGDSDTTRAPTSIQFNLFKSVDFNIYTAIRKSLKQYSVIDAGVLKW